jgi:signal transduction histidine kinase
LQNKENLSNHSATLLILPAPVDAEPAAATVGGGLQKPTEAPLYVRLLEEEEDWRASGILHDFNNQLAIILSHCSIALTKLPVESNARPNLERVIRATKRAADLSSQLHVGRIAQADEFVPVSWNELVRETVEALEPRLVVNATIEQHYAAALPPVTAIPSLIQRAILNVLTNAAEAIHTPNNTIRVVTAPVTITDVAAQEAQQLPFGTYVLLEIRDSGAGMDQATLNQIFEPYFSTKATGTGIGLTMSLHIIQLHRGIVQIRSKPNEGTTFRIFFPLADQ